MDLKTCLSARPILGGSVAITGSLLGGYVLGAMGGSAYKLICYLIWEPVEGTRPFVTPDLGSTGAWLGAASGLLVSAVWCQLVFAHRPRRPIRRGAVLGICAGLISTAIVHGGLLIALAQDASRPYKALFHPLPLGIGLACGIVFGLLLGTVAAWLGTQVIASRAGDEATVNYEH